MPFVIDDMCGWIAVVATEAALAAARADAKEKAAARTALAGGLALMGNSAAVGAGISAAMADADAVLEECGVDGDWREAVQVGGDAISTVASGGANVESIVKVGFKAAGFGLEKAGVEAGRQISVLGDSLDPTNIARGAAGAGIAAAIHHKEKDLLKAAAAGYRTGVALEDERALAGELAGGAATAAIYARAEHNSKGRAKVLDAYAAGRSFGSAAVNAGFEAAKEERISEPSGQNHVLEDDKAQLVAASKLATSIAGAGKVAEVDAKAARAKFLAERFHLVGEKHRAKDLGEISSAAGDAFAQEDLALAAVKVEEVPPPIIYDLEDRPILC